MVNVMDLFNELYESVCRSCHSRARHDATGIEVDLNCHAVDNCQFVVVAITESGSVIFNSRVSMNDNLDFTLLTEINCYDPCAEDYYNECLIEEEEE